MEPRSKPEMAVYEIKVLGELDRGWESVFGSLEHTLEFDGAGRPTTTLTGPVADQSELRGVLCQLWDLNLTLIFVRRIDTGEWSASTGRDK
jgi:hypothetical protein